MEKQLLTKVLAIKPKDIESMSKELRLFAFFVESVNATDKKGLESIYNKFQLGEKSNKINIRVLQRYLGLYSKHSDEKKQKIKTVRTEELKEINLSYNEIIARYKAIKEIVGRVNRQAVKKVDLKSI